MPAEIQCTGCGFPLDSVPESCPFCGADLRTPGAVVRRPISGDVLTPSPPFEPPEAPEPPGEFESTYELDEFVPFDDDAPAAGSEPRRFGPGLRMVAIVTGIGLVASVVGATAWIAFAVLGAR